MKENPVISDKTMLQYVSMNLNCDLCICDARGQVRSVENPYIPAPFRAAEKDASLPEQASALAKSGQPTIFRRSKKYFFGVVPFPDGEGGGYILLGPVRFMLGAAVNHRFDDSRDEYDIFTPILLSQFCLAILFLYERATGVKITLETFFIENFVDKKIEEALQNEATRIRLTYSEELSGHHTPERVKRLMDCVRTGNLEMVVDAAQENMRGGTGITSPDELRNSKNMSIAGITNITNAAIDAGVQYELAYALSDVLISKIEQADSLNKAWQLYTQACIDFTKLVRDYKQSMSGIPVNADFYTERTKAYIAAHLHEPISIADIANSLNISPNYLSTHFKKNENMTITDYIMSQKINQAKRLFIYSNMTSSEIAFRLGFSSQSHFGQMFKKHTGLTPRQFAVKFSV